MLKMRHQQTSALQEKPYWLVDICFSFQNTIRICTMYIVQPCQFSTFLHFGALGTVSNPKQSHCGKSKSLKVT